MSYHVYDANGNRVARGHHVKVRRGVLYVYKGGLFLTLVIALAPGHWAYYIQEDDR